MAETVRSNKRPMLTNLSKIQGNHSLELRITAAATYLNYWDSINGNDVTAEVRDGHLYQQDEEGEEYIYEITLGDFIAAVKSSIRKASLP